MATGGEEEEGVVSDPGTEIRSDQDEIVKVRRLGVSLHEDGADQSPSVFDVQTLACLLSCT